MKRSIIAILFLCGFAAAALAYNHAPDSRIQQGQLCRDSLGQYVSCTPGGPGNLVCSAACGAGSVCLAIDNQSHGRCHIAGSQEP